MPGAVAGSLVVGLISRQFFDLLFGSVLILIAAFLQLRRGGIVERRHRRGEVTRSIRDAKGDLYLFSYNLAGGGVFSLAVGFVASLLGIGGGPIHVPIMVQILRFPAYIATATSQYVLTFTALTGCLVHAVNGDINDGYRRMATLGVGVLLGGQVGARLSTHLSGSLLLRLLSLALLAVACRLLFVGLNG